MSFADDSGCNATFEADPGVAGLGVLISFDVTAWITIITVFIPTALIPATTRIQATVRSFRNLPPSPENTSWNSHLPRAADALLPALCDIQIVTGTAILVAGFVSLNNATYYHQSMVIELFDLILNSFWVARVALERPHASRKDDFEDAYAVTTQDSSARIMVRRVAVFCTVVLGVTYKGLVDMRQHWGWDPNVAGLCYIYHDHSTNWVWITGTSLYAIILLLTLIPQTKPGVIYLIDLIKWFQGFLFELCKLSLKQPWPDLPSPLRWSASTASAIYTFFREVCLNLLNMSALMIVSLLVWSVSQFLAICSFSSGQYLILLAVFTGFAIWNTYNIIDLRVSNADLVDGEEGGWVFGQVLPMVMLSSIGFQAMDAWHRTRDVREVT